MLRLTSLAVTDRDDNPPSSLWTNTEFLSLWKQHTEFLWGHWGFTVSARPVSSCLRLLWNLHQIFHSVFLMLQTNGTACLQRRSSSPPQVRCTMWAALRCSWAVRPWVFPHRSSPGRRWVPLFKMYNCFQKSYCSRVKSKTGYKLWQTSCFCCGNNKSESWRWNLRGGGQFHSCSLQ